MEHIIHTDFKEAHDLQPEIRKSAAAVGEPNWVLVGRGAVVNSGIITVLPSPTVVDQS